MSDRHVAVTRIDQDLLDWIDNEALMSGMSRSATMYGLLILARQVDEACDLESDLMELLYGATS